MLLTISTTHQPATDLGFLLHKNPARLHSFDLSFGRAHLFYPEATPERCTAALLLDVDPVGLVRGRRGSGAEDGALQQYVNDRPYVASSFLSVAIADVLGSALGGRSKERPELVGADLPLRATLEVVPCDEGEGFLRRLFEPLGYKVDVIGYPLDERFPEWGASRIFSLTLSSTCRLRDLLTHLYVLVPVLDGDKHYYVGDAEVEKLLRHGEGWLPAHPERDAIIRRYLKHRRGLQRQALARLIEADGSGVDDEEDGARAETQVERRVRLNDQRMGAVVAALKQSGARRVLDLGCGEGTLLRALLDIPAFSEIVGVDVSYRALEKARDRLRLDRLPPARKERVRLIHGSLTYRDRRLDGFDAAAVVEVIEHLDPPRLRAFERVLFEAARPTTVVITTPNAEYNVRFETLPVGTFRHKDHRFEWTRAEFQGWAQTVAGRSGYHVRFLPIGPEDAGVGAPTQMAIFSLERQPGTGNEGERVTTVDTSAEQKGLHA
jgi:3' terminal RNA ribose 2'-O-methyltransferase Hen1